MRSICIDFDGTLADTNRQKAQWILKNLNVEIEPHRCDRTQCVQQIGLTAYEQMSMEVYGKEATKNVSPMENAIEVVRSLSKDWDLIVVTNRTQQNTIYAEHWLKARGIFDDFELVVSSRNKEKVNLCSHFGATCLIDDDIRHLKTSLDAKIDRVLFDTSIGEAVSEEVPVLKVGGWATIKKAFEGFGKFGSLLRYSKK